MFDRILNTPVIINTYVKFYCHRLDFFTSCFRQNFEKQHSISASDNDDEIFYEMGD